MTVKSYVLQLLPLMEWVNEDSEVKDYKVIIPGQFIFSHSEVLYLQDIVNVHPADEDTYGEHFGLPYDRMVDGNDIETPIARLKFVSEKTGSYSAFGVSYRRDQDRSWVVSHVTFKDGQVVDDETSAFPLFMEAWEEFCDLVSLEKHHADLMHNFYMPETLKAAQPVARKLERPECFGTFS